ncbi:MAG: glucosylceramidase [Cyclobacteriaceae bacterium]
MSILLKYFYFLGAIVMSQTVLYAQQIAEGKIESFITNPHSTDRLELVMPSSQARPLKANISIDPTQVFQSIEGFGFAITGGTARHLRSMEQEARSALLQELFGQEGTAIGLSYIRVSIGASDLDPQPFSYNDLPDGQSDPQQTLFSLEPDTEFLMPVLKEILSVNPAVKIMASPWSPPTWMKTNGNTKGGNLKKEYYRSYGLYFAKYIKAMQAHGIEIASVTPQNEPLHPGNNPSLHMSASEQAAFIKEGLGPVFEEQEIDTKIIVYDHNLDRPDYPIEILNDSIARKYIAGSAFHLYGGRIDNLNEIRTAHPDKDLYFTEQWYSAQGQFGGDFQWHLREVLIGGIDNGCKAIIEWNLSSAPDLQPHTDGGCDACLGAITIDENNVIRNAGYYMMAHASRWVPAGSVRIASTPTEGLPNVAFKTPKGNTVLLVLNDSDVTTEFTFSVDQEIYKSSLAPGGAATIVFKP